MDALKKKSEIIAQIDVNVTLPPGESQVTFTPTSKDWMEEYLNDHFNCVLCGSTMHFKHKTDFVTQKVVEEAHCPSCGVRNRHDQFALQ